MAAGFKQWGNKIQDDIDDGVKWMVDHKIADPKRVGVYGTGFGGFIALSSLYLSPEIYACAASNSGVINLFTYFKSIPPYQKPILQMYYEIIGNPLTGIDDMRTASPLFQTDKINAPVLLAQDIKDSSNNSGEARQFVRNLTKRTVNVTYLENQGNIFAGKNEAGRLQFYNSLDDFLEFNLKRR